MNKWKSSFIIYENLLKVWTKIIKSNKTQVVPMICKQTFEGKQNLNINLHLTYPPTIQNTHSHTHIYKYIIIYICIVLT